VGPVHERTPGGGASPHPGSGVGDSEKTNPWKVLVSLDSRRIPTVVKYVHNAEHPWGSQVLGLIGLDLDTGIPNQVGTVPYVPSAS